MENPASEQIFVLEQRKIDKMTYGSGRVADHSLCTHKITVLGIRSVAMYFTDQFWVSTDSFSKQSVSITDAFSRILIKI